MLKNLPAAQKISASIPGLGRSPGEGNGNPLQYSCLENSIDRGAWQASQWGCRESDTTEQLSLFELIWGNWDLVQFSSVTQSSPTLWDPLDCSPPGSPVHGSLVEGKTTGVGCHSLFQGIFPTQGLKLHLLHCRQILDHLSHEQSPELCSTSPEFFVPLKLSAPLVFVCG